MVLAAMLTPMLPTVSTGALLRPLPVATVGPIDAVDDVVLPAAANNDDDDDDPGLLGKADSSTFGLIC